MSGANVLVARLDALGDVLLAGPAIRAVAGDVSVASVTMLCGPEGAPAAAMLPGVDNVIVWRSPWTLAPAPPVDRASVEELQSLLAESRFDRAVILTSFHQSPLPLALLLRLVGLRDITGASVDYAGSLLDVRLRPGEDFPEDQPEPLRALGIVRAAGFEPVAGDDGLLRVLPPPSAAHLVGEPGYVVLHPGGAAPARRWPAERFAETVELLTARGLRTIVTGGPGERDLTARVAGDRGLDLGGRTGIPLLAGVLAGASAVITGNTGPAHLAAAVGAPVVSLFSPVVPPSRWAPYGVPVELLGDQTAACRGTRARECPIAGHPCLAGVSAPEAVAACERLIGGRTALTRAETTA